MTKALAAMDFELIGRSDELSRITACLQARKNVLLEGPVGVGKTSLAIAVTQQARLAVWRVDGDGRYSEHKLTGWFDPPTVVRSGYSAASFFAGPLVEAMRSGGVLLINELNRLPEGVQNVLLPAMDERTISLPRLGTVCAEPGFRVIATQNPKEFVATSHLSEAILDRFELVVLGYQSEAEEVAIVHNSLSRQGLRPTDTEQLATAAVRIVRATRTDNRIRRGASVRAALSIAEIAVALLDSGMTFDRALERAAGMALPTRVELERELGSEESSVEHAPYRWVGELTTLALSTLSKKKEWPRPADQGERRSAVSLPPR